MDIPLKSVMHGQFMRDHTVLPATHMFIQCMYMHTYIVKGHVPQWVSGRYLDSPNLDSEIARRYLDSQNLDSLDSQNRVRVSVWVRVKISYDCPDFDCPY